MASNLHGGWGGQWVEENLHAISPRSHIGKTHILAKKLEILCRKCSDWFIWILFGHDFPPKKCDVLEILTFFLKLQEFSQAGRVFRDRVVGPRFREFVHVNLSHKGGKISSIENQERYRIFRFFYIYLEPKWPLFWLEKDLFWGVDL